VDLSLANPRWLATLATGAFLSWKPNVVGGLAVGMAAYVLIHAWAR
jgi:branched-subunit amino acid transport protein